MDQSPDELQAQLFHTLISVIKILTYPDICFGILNNAGDGD